MALLPFTQIGPTEPLSPLLVDSPHSGRIYPVDFAYACPLNLLRQAEDAYVDETIAGAAEVGATVLMAEFPRTMIDANRAENDIDPAILNAVWPRLLEPSPATLSGFGLVRRVCRNGIPLYRAPLTIAEVERRLAVYYRPYHRRLSQLVEERLKKFGACYLLDIHSMPHRIENGGSSPDFVLGDRDGTSCDPDFTRQAQIILQDFGYHVVLNDPYKGVEIMRRYGLTGQGAQALQIEINRRLYLDESEIKKNGGFDRLRCHMTEFFQALAKLVSPRGGGNPATFVSPFF
ncbi:MAG: N-formylglutamate amidohydrolase [Alphaproteobacteria bacterium]|nr:N-formylglutamate amidohydrolase [Alphaproteobacteria bacterium]